MRFTKKQKNTNTKVSPTLSNRAAIGIDITQHAITMVQLSSRSLNQIQLEKYVITALPKNIINLGRRQVHACRLSVGCRAPPLHRHVLWVRHG